MFEILIHPRHIGAVVTDDVMRVKQFYVTRLVGKVPNRGFYHSSKYMQITEEQLASMKESMYAKAMEQLRLAQEAVNNLK